MWRYAAGSLPLRERGLKYLWPFNYCFRYLVAPLAGAWIEIKESLTLNKFPEVAPLAGAWIEIL